eukprot:scaffold8461_cov68-Phaeocystis_antarctica.AAC.1
MRRTSRQRARWVDDDARKRAGKVAATLNCPPVLRKGLPEIASQNWAVSRARWLRTSRVSSGGTSIDADIFWPHHPAAAEEACRMHAKLADYSWPLRHVCWQRTHATLLTSTSSGFSGPPVAKDPCSGHQRDSGRTRAETAHSAVALPSTKVKTTIRRSWLASGLRRWVAGAAGPEAWQSRSHR